MAKEEQTNSQINRKKRLRAVIITFILDCLLASLAFFISRTILFFKIPEPAGYAQNEIIIAVISVVILLVMLVICDCYNVIWKYAGRVEFLKFLFAYIFTFFILFLVKIILQVVVGTQVWVPLIIIFLLFISK